MGVREWEEGRSSIILGGFTLSDPHENEYGILHDVMGGGLGVGIGQEGGSGKRDVFSSVVSWHRWSVACGLPCSDVQPGWGSSS
jgi:hypothetical protein